MTFSLIKRRKFIEAAVKGGEIRMPTTESLDFSIFERNEAYFLELRFLHRFLDSIETPTDDANIFAFFIEITSLYKVQ